MQMKADPHVVGSIEYESTSAVEVLKGNEIGGSGCPRRVATPRSAEWRAFAAGRRKGEYRNWLRLSRTEGDGISIS